MKRLLVLALLIAAILAAASVIYLRLFGDADLSFQTRLDAAVLDPDEPDNSAADASSAPRDAGDAGVEKQASAELLDLRGKVRRRLPSGRWELLSKGDPLTLDDRIRTGRDGSAMVRLGNAVQVRLTARTEVTIRELTQRTSRVRIEEGHIVAAVNPSGKTVLRVEAKGSKAVAEARGGSFSMISDGRGQIAVATTAGSVSLTSAGKAVDIQAGETAQVKGSQAPSAPKTIPTSLFLKIQAPGRRLQREKNTEIKGQATPGSLVRVGGNVALADAQGKFKIQVPLREGSNDIEVRVTDHQGQEKVSRLPEITVDTREPTIKDSQVNWGNKNPKVP